MPRSPEPIAMQIGEQFYSTVWTGRHVTHGCTYAHQPKCRFHAGDQHYMCAHLSERKKHKQLQNIWRYSFSILDTVENVSFLCPSALRPVMLFSSLSLPNALLIHASILLKNDSHISLVIMVQQNIFEKNKQIAADLFIVITLLLSSYILIAAVWKVRAIVKFRMKLCMYTFNLLAVWSFCIESCSQFVILWGFAKFPYGLRSFWLEFNPFCNAPHIHILWFHPLTLQSTPPLNWLRYAINQRANKCPMASCCCMEQQLSRSCSPEHKPKPFHIHALPAWYGCWDGSTASRVVTPMLRTLHGKVFNPQHGNHFPLYFLLLGEESVHETKTIVPQQQWTSHLQCSRLGRVRRRDSGLCSRLLKFEGMTSCWPVWCQREEDIRAQVDTSIENLVQDNHIPSTSAEVQRW